MSSTLANPVRRQPQQSRAAQRRASLLKVAALLIGELGYESVTMTAVAEHASASIGTLYDYFPDKLALAQALAAQYAEEADEHWKRLLDDSPTLKKKDLADLFVEGALAFVRKRPAYLPLLGAPFVAQRSPAARQHLRKTFADTLRRLEPNLTSDRALIRAQVIVELIKALLAICKQLAPKNREPVTAEFKRLIRFYISDSAREDSFLV